MAKTIITGDWLIDQLGDWNAAPAAMQCDYLAGNEVFGLTNLLPHDSPGVRRDSDGNTVAQFALPGHRPYLLARFGNGGVGTLHLKTDTLIVDLDEMQVVQVLRTTVMKTQPLRVLEVRMEVNEPARPGEPQPEVGGSHA